MIFKPYVTQEQVKVYEKDGQLCIDGKCEYNMLHTFTVDKTGFESWLFGGMTIQHAMPDASVDEREFLKTGLCCSPMWTKKGEDQ